MVNISEKEFITKKETNIGFSVISDFRGDEVTPISIFNGFEGRRRFIFEGGSKENHFGRYSFLGENPYLEVMGSNKDYLKDLKNDVKIPFDNKSNPFSFKGGAIGYMGYDSVCFYEKKLEFNNVDELNVPTLRFNFYKKYICYDHFTHKAYVIDNIFENDKRLYDEVIYEQKEYFNSLLNKNNINTEVEKANDITFEFSTTKENYIKSIEKAKEYIVEGDIFQVVLSQRMYCKTEKTPVEIYRRLREENPSPYMFLIDYDDYHVIGSSPESLVSVKDNKVSTNPIAGTRKRGESEAVDNKLEKELLNDKKELAEHIMLVDLGRNDIGKVSNIASVEVKDFMKIEKFSHVMHITSVVEGELREDRDAFDALAACLPAGTLSGAPKIRAMEIIEELESIKRGIYGGAVGYFSYGGNMDMSIAIRTLVLKDKIAYLQAGAGIVYDSIPEKEFEESQNKLMVLKEVLR